LRDRTRGCHQSEESAARENAPTLDPRSGTDVPRGILAESVYEHLLIPGWQDKPWETGDRVSHGPPMARTICHSGNGFSMVSGIWELRGFYPTNFRIVLLIRVLACSSAKSFDSEPASSTITSISGFSSISPSSAFAVTEKKP
jgi:hypothetical protein